MRSVKYVSITKYSASYQLTVEYLGLKVDIGVYLPVLPEAALVGQDGQGLVGQDGQGLVGQDGGAQGV